MTRENTNISERAYQHIRESLLNSDSYVGQKIPHLELGRKLGISQTPLREALFRLAAEGLLAHQNNRGFFVAEMDLEEAKEIYEARELIEPALAEKAAGLVTEKQLKAFNRTLDEYERLYAQPYTRPRLLSDKKFHLGIAKLTGNNTLIGLLTQLFDRLIMKRPFEHLSLERGKDAFEEHSSILEMLKNGEGRKAADAMREHLQKQREYVLADIKRRQTNQTMNGFRPLK